ncbi:CDP-glycerol glycerophosphotransferase family protein [Staphylococcus arlettae]|uniref:teichoic acid ribitol-phosphate polymerase TarL n=1 Tax=Staphylococcus arlettae TaxID=29378 RepID=UPI001071D563|nr:teichoic acid ribitol-phosphate polymerase TarL [Staphylococcus arlettae]MBF0738322.1 CDP-glycerol glycerophosphotransferase family protein [Staphylococcus arlettae]TFU46327.1 CDP-glycerol glycerophosphotransferase family protein [Staphylococcus arlettae]
MSKSKIIIDDIYWERIQLFIEGHVENATQELNKRNFILRNLTETKVLPANNVEISGKTFKARFNVAILNDGNYLPSGQYLLVYRGEYDYIANINHKLLDPTQYELDETDIEKYEELETKNGKNNFLLEYFKHVFKRGGNSKKTTYTVTPMISSEVNEFVIDISFKAPQPKESLIQQKIKEYRLKYNKISFNIRNFIFKTIFEVSKFFHLRKGNTVLFTSDSRAEMSGNFEYVYNEMLRQNLDKTYNIHALFKSNISARRDFIDKFKFPYLLGKADYIFVDDFHPLLYTVKFRKSQEIIQVWHAVGAFKTVGYSRTGKKGGPFFNSVNHRNYTKAFVSSETDIPFYGEAFGIKEQNIIPTGVPRTDILFDKTYEQQIVAEMEETLPIIKGKKVILFAPTFRGNGHHTAHYPFFKIDFARFARYCKENNAVVLFKMHPFVKNKLTIPREYQEYFIDVSDFREVNDILFVTDILISDYSSLVYEFAVFKRPMLFYAFDLEDYITSRDFYEPYETFVPGKIVESFDDLIVALDNEDFEQEKVPKFLDKHFKYQDGRSSERLVRNLFGS